ncbi:hypothetical protein PGTUg99_019489 [Puccinia graminis f. sp. tritici]|uniref:Uncharacterized protein n=1 Tax=Puccinia graminis f. sp. tritici TaxID=56615 RepID=A0A5B0NAF5_PUCGR|nr:hypothetical protein PGTUg99_019489 [Puccinia graminis f. sp. tritici]
MVPINRCCTSLHLTIARMECDLTVAPAEKGHRPNHSYYPIHSLDPLWNSFMITHVIYTYQTYEFFTPHPQLPSGLVIQTSSLNSPR